MLLILKANAASLLLLAAPTTLPPSQSKIVGGEFHQTKT